MNDNERKATRNIMVEDAIEAAEAFFGKPLSEKERVMVEFAVEGLIDKHFAPASDRAETAH